MEQRSFRVVGRVQGVGFRWWTLSQARRLGITGTVRNCEDGTVEIRARGSTVAVSELRRLLRAGPPGAQVREVQEADAPEARSDSFEIVR